MEWLIDEVIFRRKRKVKRYFQNKQEDDLLSYRQQMEDNEIPSEDK